MVNEDKVKKRLLKYAKKHLMAIDPSRWKPSYCGCGDEDRCRGYSIRIGPCEFVVGMSWMSPRDNYFLRASGEGISILTNYRFAKKLFNKVDAKYAEEQGETQRIARMEEASRLQKLEKFLSE